MIWRVAAALGLLALTTAVYGKEYQTASPKIPSYLIECYKNESIYHRSNRLPMTLRTFLDLVRQIENSPSGKNLNARQIVSNLIFFLKMDGIERAPASDNQPTSDVVVPFGIFGQDYFRHRIMLVKLLGTPSQDNYQWLAERLTYKEICNLHFMLSYSIDTIRRSDENCGNIATQSQFNRGGRFNRDVSENSESQESEHREKQDENAQVEMLPPHITDQANEKKTNESDKSDFTIGKHDLLTSGFEGPLRAGIRSQRYPMQPNSRINLPSYDRSQCPVENGVIQTPYGSLVIGTVLNGILAGLEPRSIRPSDFGVTNDELRPDIASTTVDNLWAATLAGDVASMIMESSFTNNDYNNDIGAKGGWNNTADPKWYLLQKDVQGQLTDAKLLGAIDGYWLGQLAPSWVSSISNLRLSQILDMYYSSVATGGTAQACNRKSQYNNIVNGNDFIQQLEIFSLVLQRQQVKPTTIEDFADISRQAVNNIKDYINQMSPSCQLNDQTATSSQQTFIDYSTNLAIVIDSSWPYDVISNILMQLSNNAVVASPYNSNTTIFCGMDGNILAQVTNSIELARDFNATTFAKCARGFNIGSSFYQLKVFFRLIYQNEKNLDKTQKGSHTVLLMPYSQTTVQANSSSEKANFKISMPDVKFFVATNGAKDGFRDLVDNIETDAFMIRALTPNDQSAIQQLESVANAIKNVPQRLSLPKCASYWSDASGTGTLTDDVQLGYTKTYRLQSNYYHVSEGSPKFTVKSKTSVSLLVCFSRKNPNPTGSLPDLTTQSPINTNNNNNINNNDPYRRNNGNYNPYGSSFNPRNRYNRQVNNNGKTGDANCKQITTGSVDFSLPQEPCDGLYIYNCDPVYLSVYAPQSTDNPRGNCADCRLPTNAQYEIEIEGLTCDSGVGQLLSNPIAMLISTLTIIAVAFL